jgi:uracil-DNA glycosylase
VASSPGAVHSSVTLFVPNATARAAFVGNAPAASEHSATTIAQRNDVM